LEASGCGRENEHEREKKAGPILRHVNPFEKATAESGVPEFLDRSV
jgi:hypothetical protein